jgi:hypothetical protein
LKQFEELELEGGEEFAAYVCPCHCGRYMCSNFRTDYGRARS